MKCPVNTRQQPLHTAYMEQAINNKNIHMMFFTKPHNVENNDRPASLISLIPTKTSLKSRLYCSVAVGRSVCEDFRHIQVSRT